MGFFRLVLRSLFFSYISLYVAQTLVGGFFFGLESQKTLTFVVLTIALLNMFIIPLLKVLGLPHRGIMFLLLSIVLTSIVFYILPMFINGFRLLESTLAQLRIFGFVLPSRHLSVLEATLASGFFVALVFHFFEWLVEKR
ncbi:hypothetical protein HYV31_02580 [candidate division WWE3 bacterium]|nr:hypothetical protein [candidate division WWE3 bacterium]